MTLNLEDQSATVGEPLPGPWIEVAGAPEQLTRNQRKVLAIGGLGLIAALVVARCLTPDPQGFGTHRQLGMPSCTFAHLFGIPCPSCGMTTSWAHLMRGQILQAAACNLGGLVAGLTAMLVGPWALVSGIRGRWWLGPPRASLVATWAIGIYIVITGQWLARFW